MIDLLIVADDLTGALDTGAQFARYGRRTLVSWAGGGLPPADADVWVLDTETRALPPAEARAAVAQAVAPFLPVLHIYKKVDSTLRGPIGAELEALLALGVAEQALLAPAFPAQGRTVLGGELRVHGQPLAQTPFAQPGRATSLVGELIAASTRLAVDSMGLQQVRQGVQSLARAVDSMGLQQVRQGVQSLARALAAQTEPVLVLDALTEADLAVAAQAAALAGRDRLLAGSAGLAAQLPAVWGWARPKSAAAPAAVTGPILCVAATKHPALAGQLLHLQQQAQLEIVKDVLPGILPGEEPAAARAAAAVVEALAQGRDVALTTLGAPLVAGGDRLVVALLGRIAAQALQQARPGALMLTGGDTAMAVCRTLGAEAIIVEGQVEAGVPLGRLAGGEADGLPIATKAGGFGDEGVLWRMACALRGRAHEIPTGSS